MGRPKMPVGSHGNIVTHPLGPKKFEARAWFRDVDGKRKHARAIGPSRSGAERNLTHAITEKTKHGTVVGTDTRFTEVIDKWLAEVDESVRLSTNTKRLYRLSAETHVRPRLGQLFLSELTVPAIDNCLRAIRDSKDRGGRGAAKTARAVLSGALGVAVRSGVLRANPVREAISLPSEKKAATRALTVTETEDLTMLLRADPRAIRFDLPDLVEWMLYTGCRIGEALAARDSVIDLEHGTWEVNATVIRIKGDGLTIQPRTKTDAGWRVLALPPGAVAMIERRQTERRLQAPGGIIFGSPTAKSLRDPSNTSRDLREVLKDIGRDPDSDKPGPFDWVTSHTFRKTVATRLDDAHLSARQIADQLGHANPSLTQDVYMGRQVVNAEAARLLDR